MGDVIRFPSADDDYIPLSEDDEDALSELINSGAPWSEVFAFRRAAMKRAKEVEC
jgi:hypothetical protein